MKKKIFFWCMFLIVGWCFAFNVQAEDVVQVVTENWSPYNFEEKGVVKGSSTETVRKVLEKANIKHTIKVYPWARSYKMALEQKNV
ncbi:MAG: hypothetical protein C0403_02920, partial [Desulfobacterium sp.]|nr:hypothetical protein [Desulfobacterium sp.]